MGIVVGLPQRFDRVSGVLSTGDCAAWMWAAGPLRRCHCSVAFSIYHTTETEVCRIIWPQLTRTESGSGRNNPFTPGGIARKYGWGDIGQPPL